jgi:hypothetical protein
LFKVSPYNYSDIQPEKNSGQGKKNNENQNDKTDSGSSKISETSCSETVLPKIKVTPVEADLIPPKTYKAIVANKKNKEKVGTIGGITSGQDPIECGSFYNSSDNRVARSVYKEDLISMSVTSMSFNPKTWLCTACPKSHSVLEEGGRGGGGDGRPVVFVTDQNFPAVLPSAGGRCLAIMRMEQATMDDLADMVIKLAKTVTIPESTVFVVGSLSHLSRIGTHGYAISRVNVRRRLSWAFKGVRVVPFSPPPLGGCNDPELIRSMLDSCIWLAGTLGYPLSETQKVIVDMIMEDEEGGGHAL